jgi:hypothetical protein
MVIRVKNVPAKVVNEARDPSHNTPAILTMDQQNDRIFSVCHRVSTFPMKAVRASAAAKQRYRLEMALASY